MQRKTADEFEAHSPFPFVVVFLGSAIVGSMLSLVMLLGMAGESPRNVDGARDFVRAVYARYSSADDSDTYLLGQKRRAELSPSLLRLIQHDIDTTPKGEVGKLDFDPICSCQDPGGMRVESIAVHVGNGHLVIATVKLRFPEPKVVVVRLTLMEMPDGWKIDDVGSADVPSLRKFLRSAGE